MKTKREAYIDARRDFREVIHLLDEVKKRAQSAADYLPASFGDGIVLEPREVILLGLRAMPERPMPFGLLAQALKPVNKKITPEMLTASEKASRAKLFNFAQQRILQLEDSFSTGGKPVRAWLEKYEQEQYEKRWGKRRP